MSVSVRGRVCVREIQCIDINDATNHSQCAECQKTHAHRTIHKVKEVTHEIKSYSPLMEPSHLHASHVAIELCVALTGHRTWWQLLQTLIPFVTNDVSHYIPLEVAHRKPQIFDTYSHS